MPNHVTNRLIIQSDSPEKVKEIRDFIRGSREVDEGTEDLIDFNNIIPMPKALHIEDVRYGDKDKQAEVEKIYAENVRLYGFETWYGWSCANWGTKWNAYDILEVAPNIIQFDTAWSCPEPVITALAEKFPGVTFILEYADEDIGRNCGTIEFLMEEGEESVNVIDLPRDGDIDFALEIKGIDREEWDSWEEE